MFCMVTMAHGGLYTHLGYYGDNGNHSDAVHVLVIFLNMYICIYSSSKVHL